MEIREGMFYMQRDGCRVGPMSPSKHGWTDGKRTWQENGHWGKTLSFWVGASWDIVAECHEPMPDGLSARLNVLVRGIRRIERKMAKFTGD